MVQELDPVAEAFAVAAFDRFPPADLGEGQGTEPGLDGPGLVVRAPVADAEKDDRSVLEDVIRHEVHAVDAVVDHFAPIPPPRVVVVGAGNPEPAVVAGPPSFDFGCRGRFARRIRTQHGSPPHVRWGPSRCVRGPFLGRRLSIAAGLASLPPSGWSETGDA